MDGSLFVLCRLCVRNDGDSLVRSNDTKADHHATDDADDVSGCLGEFNEHEGRSVASREIKLPSGQVSNDCECRTSTNSQSRAINVDDIHAVKRIVAVTSGQDSRLQSRRNQLTM